MDTKLTVLSPFDEYWTNLQKPVRKFIEGNPSAPVEVKQCSRVSVCVSVCWHKNIEKCFKQRS